MYRSITRGRNRSPPVQMTGHFRLLLTNCGIIKMFMANSQEKNPTRKQLLEEVQHLREQIAALETREYTYKQVDELLNILRINSPVGLFLIQEKKFVFTNRQFLTIMGYQGDELMGTQSLDHVHPEDKEMVRKKAIKMLKGQIDTPYQYRLIGKDGQVRWVLEGVVSVQYKGKRAALGHTMNITYRIKAVNKLRKLLEKEKRLRHQLEEEVNKRVEYTRMLVHELKTPLTPVLFSSELLVSEIHDEPLASVARNIHQGATNLDNRINELLDTARGEIGLLKINPQMIDVHQLLTGVARYIQPLMDRNQQTFVADIPKSLPQVWADEERLQQVILNLLTNASKYSPEGSKISLRGKQEKDNLVVQVADTGPGIPREDQKRIFKPHQKYKGSRESLSGLGLGLSLCKSLVELHGGKIWINSRKGYGTTFTFSIPLKAPAADNPG